MALRDNIRLAIEKLAEGREPFTRIDVVNNAARGKGWAASNYKQARETAHQQLAGLYNRGVVHRYGPVPILGIEDYLRAASEIVYGGEKATDAITTPNGTFAPLTSEKDGIRTTAGRRPGGTRDDFKPWSEQDLKVKGASEPAEEPVDPAADGNGQQAQAKGPPVDHKPLEKRIQDLERQLSERNNALQAAQSERDQLQARLEEYNTGSKAKAPQDAVSLPIGIPTDQLRKALARAGMATSNEVNSLLQRVEAAERAAHDLRELAKQAPKGDGEVKVDEDRLKELIKETLAEALIS